VLCEEATMDTAPVHTEQPLRVGLPRGLLFYPYELLWTTFFETLGFEVVVSPPTNLGLVSAGSKLAPSESCVPLKVYLGHVLALKDKADYVLVPRIVSVRRNEENCQKFMATYDTVANLIPDVSLICYSVDVRLKQREAAEMCRMAAGLGIGRTRALAAYGRAKILSTAGRRLHASREWRRLRAPALGPKVLVVAHGYCMQDALIGGPIVSLLEAEGAEVFSADALVVEGRTKRAAELSQELFWTYNRELLDVVVRAKSLVDGVVFVASFPCGPDALVTDLAQRRLRDVPVMTLVVDDLTALGGLKTRIESFVDVVRMRQVPQ
jgi:predicted nucleotide-binding protein (sugar kinase/HSP70/actin superfamily)